MPKGIYKRILPAWNKDIKGTGFGKNPENIYKGTHIAYNKGTHITNSGSFKKGVIPKNKTNLFKQCLVCSKDFKYIKSREEIARFCSRECFGKSRVGYVPKSAFKKGKMSGENNPMYGKPSPRKGMKLEPFSDEYKKKISEGLLKSPYILRGENHPFYKDGRAKMPGYDNFLSKRHKLRKKNNGGTHSYGDWNTLKAQYNFTCPCCLKQEPEITLTEDHIIPVSKGGSDNIENIQPLCRSCNSRKNAKIIEKYKPIFIED